jgi:hypothetical protein
MVEFCRFQNCHNLVSSTFQGYCNQYHKDKGAEYELLMKILEKNPNVSTIKEAREFLRKKEIKQSVNGLSLTSSFHYEVYTRLPQ